jgi:hypothetical protein
MYMCKLIQFTTLSVIIRVIVRQPVMKYFRLRIYTYIFIYIYKGGWIIMGAVARPRIKMDLESRADDIDVL